ncbi:MAG: hypothetical protein ABJE10_22955 [bacterium]
MKVLLIAFAGALVIGVGAASGATMMRAPAAVPASDSAKAAHVADSLKALAVDTSQHGRIIEASDVKGPAPLPGVAPAVNAAAASPTAEVSAPVKPVVSAPVTSAASHDVPKPSTATKPPVSATPAPTSAPAASAPLAFPEHRIAHVFATMAPRDAARVLEQMSDADIASILGNITDKQMAAILAKLPPARVATLSKLGLKSSAAKP